MYKQQLPKAREMTDHNQAARYGFGNTKMFCLAYFATNKLNALTNRVSIMTQTKGSALKLSVFFKWCYLYETECGTYVRWFLLVAASEFVQSSI